MREIAVTDSYGRQVKVPSPPKRIVSINNNVTEMICALGEIDRIAGVSDSDDFPPSVKGKEKVGPPFTPSVERILELKPDVVFAYGPSGGPALKRELADKIEAMGIPLVYIDAYKPESFSSDVRTLGRILNREEEAERYIALVDKYRKLVEERVGKLKPEERVRVYLEGRTGDYVTYGQKSGGHQRIVMAGGANIAGNEPIPYPRVNAEWVLRQNPQVILKEVMSKRVPIGYGVTETEALKEMREAMMKRAGWDQLDAVKNGRVYLISTDLSASPRDVITLCYMAKWFYPKLFEDIDPSSIHREILEKFHGLQYRGLWVYPEA